MINFKRVADPDAGENKIYGVTQGILPVLARFKRPECPLINSLTGAGQI